MKISHFPMDDGYRWICSWSQLGIHTNSRSRPGATPPWSNRSYMCVSMYILYSNIFKYIQKYYTQEYMYFIDSGWEKFTDLRRPWNWRIDLSFLGFPKGITMVPSFLGYPLGDPLGTQIFRSQTQKRVVVVKMCSFSTASYLWCRCERVASTLTSDFTQTLKLNDFSQMNQLMNWRQAHQEGNKTWSYSACLTLGKWSTSVLYLSLSFVPGVVCRFAHTLQQVPRTKRISHPRLRRWWLPQGAQHGAHHGEIWPSSDVPLGSGRRCALHPDRPQGVHRRTDTWRCSESEHNQCPGRQMPWILRNLAEPWGTLGNLWTAWADFTEKPWKAEKRLERMNQNKINWYDINRRKSREISAHKSCSQFVGMLPSIDPQHVTCDDMWWHVMTCDDMWWHIHMT